ncbi:MAG: integrase core domain-containing protein, partial [Candidatus Nitrosopolaris sp.]
MCIGKTEKCYYLISNLYYRRSFSNILGRVHHPQTTGKIERFYETFQSKIEHFNSMEQFVIWYNTKRPHMSLNWDQL